MFLFPWNISQPNMPSSSVLRRIGIVSTLDAHMQPKSMRGTAPHCLQKNRDEDPDMVVFSLDPEPTCNNGQLIFILNKL